MIRWRTVRRCPSLAWATTLLLAAALDFTGPLDCAAAQPATAVAGSRALQPLSIVDDTGARLSLSRTPARIVSLAPGATEMLFAIDAGARVVGTSRYSDEPAAARNVPRVGDVAGLDLERILSLRPEVLVVWQGGNPAAQIEQLVKLEIPLYRQHVTALQDLPGSLQRLSLLVGNAARGAQLAQQLNQRLAALRAAYAGRPTLRVFLQIWNRPLYTVGGRHAMSDALSYCGAQSIFLELAGEAPAVSLEAVLRRDPEVIVADAPPGQAQSWLADWRRFPRLKAVRRGALLPFEDQRFGLLGPSALDAAEKLCVLLDGVRESAHKPPRSSLPPVARAERTSTVR